jgi:hypothetical protein
MATDNWPTFGEELARKALDVVHVATHDHLIEGTISERELRLIVDAVFNTISGLAPWDVSDLIYKIRTDLGLQK